MQITSLYKGHDLLGESPLWHPQEQQLYWVDALKPALHAFNPLKNQHREWPMPDLIASIALNQNGGLIAALRHSFAWIDLPSGDIHTQFLIREQDAPFHLNDGKCDALGRFFAGEVSHDKTHPTGQLYCVHPNGKIEIKMTGLALFNGPCWSPCNRFFYFTDSFQKIIYRCDYDLKTATLGKKQIFIQIPETDPSTPDGCTVDAEGYLWSAKWNGHRITRYTPDGQIDQEIPLPIQRPTSCMFGGKNLDTLFVTSCSQDLNETRPLKDPKAGQIFAIQFKQSQGIF
ncbi:MAG: SMP-30/gluconolactonase/LRE family protein [Gammaproteobacteria bacterium]|nr:SMP-30/gluconolactonase/LRE family protein [Gammaproteobacteria bacterium]